MEVRWEEQMYWKHFNVMHFYQVLPHDFFDRLVLPSKFAENMSGKIPKKLSLIGPSGSSWEVDVSATGNLAIVGDGWKDFAKTYNLEENYLLMFKYTQNLSFEVLIFDQKKLCEKEYSYFVKKCSPKPNDKVDRKRSADETASMEMIEDNDDGGDCVMPKKLKKCSTDHGIKNVVEAPRATPSHDSSDDFSDDNDVEAVEVVSSGGRPIHQVSLNHVPNEADIPDGIPITGLMATNSEGQSGKPSDNNTTGVSVLSQLNAIQQTPTGNGKKEMYEAVVLSPSKKGNALYDASSAEVLNGTGTPGTSLSRKVSAKRGRNIRRAIPRSGQKLAFKSATRRLAKEYVSHRKVVTDEEKEAALKRGIEASTEDSFLIVMRPTAVYKRFYLSIPADWVNKNLSCHHQKVILRVGEKTWVAMFHNYGRGRHSGGLATGWKNFAIGNNLEDSDVCVFTPASQKGDATLILDVKIFRVVPEITPLTPLMCCVV